MPSSSGRRALTFLHTAAKRILGGDDVKPDLPTAGGVTRSTIVIGAVSGLLLFSFAAWASLAPLHGAVIANGFVKVSGNRQKVQHLEGGIIDEIFVKDGDRVEKGGVLLRLKNRQLAASEKLLDGQLLSALALEARIKAEQVDAAGIVFPPELLQRRDSAIDQYIEAQRNIFDARNVAYRGSLTLKDERINQTRQEIQAYLALATALRKQLPLIKVEIEDQLSLWNRQLTKKREVHTLKRAEAQIEAEIEKNMAMVARARATIAELEEDKLQLRRKFLDELAQERKVVNDSIFELRQRLLAVGDAVERLEIKAPISGTVVMLNVNTPSGVISPREVIMEIVPGQAHLMIEASIKTADIDVVRAGMVAQLQFSAYTARRTNKVMGRVVLVSADRITDSQGRASYRVDIEVPEDDVRRITGLTLHPGMPADAFIETGERSLAQYVLAPVLDGLGRGIKER